MQQTPSTATNDPTPGDGKPVSLSILRLREASLVKSASKRVNAEPNASPSANPWSSTRPVSPVESSGKSYAEALSPSRPQSPDATELSALVATAPPSPKVKIEPTEEIIPDAPAPTQVSEDNKANEPIEVSDASDQDVSRTRSGRRISAPKAKPKSKAKKAKPVVLQSSTTGEGPSAPTTPVATAEPAPRASAEATPPPLTQPARTPRLVSESKKRRRVSTDVGGDGDAGGTSTRVQNTPPSHQRTVGADRSASSLLSYAGSPPRDRVDPPAITTSDIEATDADMMEVDSDDDLPNGQLRPPYSASSAPIPATQRQHTDPTSEEADAVYQKRLGKQPERGVFTVSNAATASTQPSGAKRIAKHAIYGAIYQGNPTPPAQYAFELGRTRSGTQIPRASGSNSNPEPRPPTPRPATHPNPVHYAPGPFPVPPNGPPPQTAPQPQPALPPPMALSRAPVGGHLQIQGSDPHFFLRNIRSMQLQSWPTIHDDFVFIQFPGKGSQDTGNDRRMQAAETVLTKHLGINGASLIQPLPEIVQPRPNADPRWYRLGGLRPQEREMLTQGVWWDAPEGTFCVISPHRAPPTYIGTWRHARRLGATTEDGMAAGFRATLALDQPAAFITALLVADHHPGGRWRHLSIAESFQLILASAYVRQMTLLSAGNDGGEPVASLYIESPTVDATEWVAFRTYLRGLEYGGALAGPPELIEYEFFCTYCHSIDHPDYLCKVPSTPGWHGPSLEKAREAITTERRIIDRNNGRGGPRGGRGRGGRGRGRGGYRGRGGFAATQD